MKGMHSHRLNRRYGVLLLCAALAASAGAQSNGPYRMAPAAVANGGGTLGGGAFQLSGTLGQAQTATSAGTGFRLAGGFWAPASDAIFVNGFDK